MRADQAINLEDFKQAARRYLPRMIFDYIEGAAEDELALARNRTAFETIELVPRFLCDVSTIDQSAALMGNVHAFPVGIAPTGMAAITRCDADLLLAEVAHAAGVPFILSGASNSAMEKIAAIAPSAWYQIYVPKREDIRRDQIRRVADAGLGTLVFTVDIPIYSKRERDIRSGWVRPYTPSWGSKIEALRYPRWLLNYLRTGIPTLENWLPYCPPGSGPMDVTGFFAEQAFAVQTWDLLRDMRDQFKGRLVVKGILSAEDAAMAVEAGVDGIIVSNHGGRQFDKGPAALTVLPGICDAVAGRVPVMIDSGINRGSDVVAALCLGASFAFVGRATLYAVASHGREGVTRALDILRQEIHLAMASIGCIRLSQLDRSYLR